MQGENVVLDGHLVEQDGEDALLHLAGVFGSQDDHFFLGEVDGDRGGRGHAGGESIGREGTGVVNDIVRVEMLELFPARANEHVPHEEGMVRSSADDSDVDAVTLIPAGKAIDDVNSVAGVQIVDCSFAVDTPDLLLFSHPSVLPFLFRSLEFHVTRASGVVLFGRRGARGGMVLSA